MKTCLVSYFLVFFSCKEVDIFMVMIITIGLFTLHLHQHYQQDQFLHQHQHQHQHHLTSENSGNKQTKHNNYHMTERPHFPRRPCHFSDYRHKSEALGKKSRFPLMNHEVNVISSFGRAILFSNLGFNKSRRFCPSSCQPSFQQPR